MTNNYRTKNGRFIKGHPAIPRHNPKKMTRICLICGKKFITYPCYNKKFCSFVCSGLSRKGKCLPIKTKQKMSNARKGIKNAFYGKKHTKETKEFISNILRKRIHTIESRKKRSIKMSGKNAPHWKGGISKGYKTGYYSMDYRGWRKSVFERDNYTCQFCLMKGVYITAHHIKSFAQYPKLRFDINNGITLCSECHKLTDNYKGRARK